MLRIVRLLAAFVGLVLVTLFAIGNRSPVDVSFWPSPVTVDLPLYGVFLIGLGLGVLVTAAIAAVELFRLRLQNRRLARRLHGYEYQARLRESTEDEEAVRRIRERGRSTALVAGPGS